MAISSSPTKENDAADDDADPKKNTTSTTPTSRTALAWQRRPTSRSGTGGRPLSMLAAQNATQRSLAGSQEPQSATETSFSKDQIAQSLGSKDPSWFRQTADRGLSSAAYRKNQVEDEERADVTTASAQLPGMSDAPGRDRSTSIVSNTSSLASPLPLNPAGFDGPGNDDDAATTEEAPPSSPGRSSPTRSNSPTKGMGGFVQSAIMKRSNSVKRWSVTSPPGLARADSVATNNRGSYTNSRPQSLIRPSPTTPAKPAQEEQGDGDDEDTPTVVSTTTGVSTAATAGVPSPTKTDEEEPPIPTSPSKTMDHRRWSPTKSSWLESALSKPESPKPSTKPHTPTQPAWMVELNKNKTDRTGNNVSEGNRSSHKHQVSIGGLMRSSPMGADAKPNTTGLGGIYSPPVGGNKPPLGHASRASISLKAPELKPAESRDEAMDDKQEDVTAVPQTPVEPPSEESIPAVKPSPKPSSPPKTDFRTALRPRPVDSGTTKPEEPEFKNALGNLRRTKTQNYVAPDELKGNILRGKAALNLTGGPQKTEHKDEFKEAIQTKKEDFQKAQAEGRGVTRARGATTTAQDKPLPEGLARRATLGKISGIPKVPVPESSPKPVFSTRPVPGPKREETSQTSASPVTPSAISPGATSPPAEPLAKVQTVPEVSKIEPRAIPSLPKETSAPPKLGQGRGNVGKLADRFNPGLAGMLARGPPPMASNGGKRDADSETSKPTSTNGSSEPSAPGPQLTHMTKGRARGPKRRAPASTVSATPASPEAIAAASSPVHKPDSPKREVTTPTETAPEVDSSPDEPSAPSDEKDAASSEEKPAALSIQQQVAAKAALRGQTPFTRPLGPRTEPEKEEGQSGAGPFPLRRRPTSPEKPTAVDPPSPVKTHKTGGDGASQPGSPKKLDVKRMSKFLDDPSSSPELGKEPIKPTHQRTRSRSPVKTGERSFLDDPSSPTKVDSEHVASVGDSTSLFGGGMAKSPPLTTKSPPQTRSKPSVDSPSTPTSSRPSSRAFPIPSLENPRSPPQIESPLRSPLKHANELSHELNDFFGADRQRNDYKVDPAELLMNKPQAGAKIQSLGVQMMQLSGDGKKIPVPSHNERVLFDQEMYVCPHEFQDQHGRKFCEVYYWIGDEVPDATAEDAQIFASREARSLGARLVKFRQGKETPGFVQALGGVIITRRGSSSKYDSLAPQMLCGRRYHGQVAFDQVDFTPLNLCSGFPYLITQGGKCYLWKGKGSDVDELSGARLIGMDLSLTGELIEYEDGNEPESFWDIFESGAKSRPHSADHWKLKPSYGKYGSRLFCSDAESRQQVST